MISQREMEWMVQKEKKKKKGRGEESLWKKKGCHATWRRDMTPIGSHLLRGFLAKHHLIPKYSFHTWLVSRTYPYELPKLNEHKFTSHSTPCNILYVNKLTMLFVGILNSRSNSLQLRGMIQTKYPRGWPRNQEANHTMSNDLSNQVKALPNIRRTSP